MVPFYSEVSEVYKAFRSQVPILSVLHGDKAKLYWQEENGIYIFIASRFERDNSLHYIRIKAPTNENAVQTVVRALV